MSGSRNGDFEALSRAFAAREQSPGTLDQCPAAEQLFEAASGVLEREQRLKIVDHVSQCAECTRAWRMAMELDARPVNDVEQPDRTPSPRLRSPAAWRGRSKMAGIRRLALAASILCAVGVAAYFYMPADDQQPRYRDVANKNAPVSLVTGNLARDRFLLRWSAGPPGSTYVLRLTTEDLAPLLIRQSLTEPELTVPSEVLADVASGEQLLWQVETQLPNGQRIASETYIVTLD